ncbi:ATP-binding protein [Streptomyces sp. NBC_01304]|uniref:ATP-binding protein n=1 Tax=Streptomyces sp. NBC_01304 TaxID=2903818 RepID=UPI002E15BCA2|nr:ATP-binding protein [Streptomyces sp. NBC_01304]
MTSPLFLAPDDHRGNIIQVDRALESMRDAGFDLTAAIGEPLDNSIQAEATLMRVIPVYGARKKSIEKLIISDNGVGIDPSIMHNVLSIGYSARYNERDGLGRFGMGLKLAGLSLGKRIDIYSKRANSPTIHHSYVDLEEVREGKQQYISTDEVQSWPEEAARQMVGRDSRPLASGTVVIFSKIDRLSTGGTYGTSLEEKISDLRKFIARAFRTYIDTGRTIELEGKEVTLHDPLFQRDNPRIISKYKSQKLDPRGTIIEDEDIEIDGHKVHVTVALVPVEFRPWAGAGGAVDHRGDDIRDFQINAENAGKISILRNGREIFYDTIPRFLDATRNDKAIRYVAIEVTFPAELDEYFQVRNVKRGAEPVTKLRNQLKDWLKRPVRVARKQIHEHWIEVDTRKRLESGPHDASMATAARANPSLPHGLAGRTVTPEQEEQIVLDAAEDMGLDPEVDVAKVDALREQIRTKPITLFDASWPGKEFIVVQHLNGKALVKFNLRHAFFKEVYVPLKKLADQGTEGMTPEDMLDLARRAETAIDLLFMGYARAESMSQNPEEDYSQLRTHWGMFTEAMLKEELKDQ